MIPSIYQCYCLVVFICNCLNKQNLKLAVYYILVVMAFLTVEFDFSGEGDSFSDIWSSGLELCCVDDHLLNLCETEFKQYYCIQNNKVYKAVQYWTFFSADWVGLKNIFNLCNRIFEIGAEKSKSSEQTVDNFTSYSIIFFVLGFYFCPINSTEAVEGLPTMQLTLQAGFWLVQEHLWPDALPVATNDFY